VVPTKKMKEIISAVIFMNTTKGNVSIYYNIANRLNQHIVLKAAYASGEAHQNLNVYLTPVPQIRQITKIHSHSQ
tara:strand:+ start:336 stop:560 length:225 start_codon:yes stop_codon:yes gene_type:complete